MTITFPGEAYAVTLYGI